MVHGHDCPVLRQRTDVAKEETTTTSIESANAGAESEDDDEGEYEDEGEGERKGGVVAKVLRDMIGSESPLNSLMARVCVTCSKSYV